MKYLSVAEARDLPGRRLVLTAGVPGPWGEAAKAVLKLRGLSFHPVEQTTMAANEELVAWTGHRNAPILCVDDQPPLVGWLDILLHAELTGSGAPLIPADEGDRALCLGYATEICGPDGFGWNRRHLVMATYMGGALPGPEAPAHLRRTLSGYGVDDAAVARAPQRLVDIMGGLAKRLRSQAERGSEYFIGETLSALDVYWACFSLMVRPLPAEVNPMPDWLWSLYTACGETVEGAIDPILIAHRDRIFDRHIGLPLEF